MNIELTEKEFRRLLDLVYVGNWILNSTRGNDRFEDYDLLQEKMFAMLDNGGTGADLVGQIRKQGEMIAEDLCAQGKRVTGGDGLVGPDLDGELVKVRLIAHTGILDGVIDLQHRSVDGIDRDRANGHLSVLVLVCGYIAPAMCNTSYLLLQVMRPRVRSYGDICTVTLSPGRILIKFIRSFPEMCARMVWPFPISTVNMVLGRDSTTVPSSSITSSFAKVTFLQSRSLDASVTNPLPL